MYYCEIIAYADEGEATFYRGQGSSPRVAAMRAIAKLVAGTATGFGSAGTWENVRIKTGRVG